MNDDVGDEDAGDVMRMRMMVVVVVMMMMVAAVVTVLVPTYNNIV
jgi:hypothetical protein